MSLIKPREMLFAKFNLIFSLSQYYNKYTQITLRFPKVLYHISCSDFILLTNKIYTSHCVSANYRPTYFSALLSPLEYLLRNCKLFTTIITLYH